MGTITSQYITAIEILKDSGNENLKPNTNVNVSRSLDTMSFNELHFHVWEDGVKWFRIDADQKEMSEFEGDIVEDVNQRYK
jgi:hypothetical protein